MAEQNLFYYLAGVPLLGVAAQWLAWRFRFPSILLLLGFGIILGQFINPDEMLGDLAGSDASVGPRLLLPVVSLAVAVILFEGGLTLRISELKDAGSIVFRLVVGGALIAWITTATASWKLLGLDPGMAALLGAVLVVTGPTVVAPLLRQIRPSRRIGSILKWEGIVIDPIGAVLAVLVFEEVLTGEGTATSMISLLVQTAAVGVLLGGATAFVLIQFVKRYWVPDFLHGVVFLSAALGTFAVSNWLKEESGLVTVTVLGVILANQKSISIKHVIEFKEHLRVLLISMLFIVLGSRLDPKSLFDLGWEGVAFLIALIVFIRPLSVFLSTLGSGLNIRERCFLACLAPRGIVAAAVISVFALKMTTLSAEHPRLAEQAEQLVPITFLVIVGTVAFYGLLAGPLARYLKLSDANPQGVLIAGAETWMRQIALALQNEGQQVMLIDTNYRNIAEAKMAGLPAECASILSEYVREEIDLGGIGKMLALTPNDEVNTLAVLEFAHLFGRANVYQLPSWDASSGRRTSVTEHLRGRVLFSEELNYDELGRLVALEGMQVKNTQLTEEFGFEQFIAMYGESTIVLFMIDEAKKLIVCTADKPPVPQPGQTVMALINPKPDKIKAEPAAVPQGD